MNKPKNLERLIERHFENLHVQPHAEMDPRILRDATEAMEAVHRARTGAARAGIGRIVMVHRTRRVAAILALAIVLAGVIGLAGGPVAFSQVGQAVNSTLARLKEMIWDIRTGNIPSPAPAPAAPAGDTDEQPSDTTVRGVMCAARFFSIPAGEQAVWQALREQGIELIQASSAPETYYAPLSRDQAGRVEGALTAGPITSPRVLVGEGGEAVIASNVFALAWRPTLSSDATRIESSFSFHDGQSGFEIPSVSAEDGGVVLVRVRGIMPTGEDVLLLLTVTVPPAP
jgi:hypothetical protein